MDAVGALISRPVVSSNGIFWIFFWLLRILVKVRWTFFLTGALVGLQLRSATAIVVWILVVFVAILLHELGHALAARWYRQSPQIELHAMGGVTKWAWIDELRWRDRVVITLAGPAVGLVLGGLMMLSAFWYRPPSWYPLALAWHQFIWVTVGWGMFNLLPLLPLDGGQALAELLEHRHGREEGRRRTRKISFATGIAGLALGIAAGQVWAALLCGIFAFDNYQRMHGLPGVKLPG